jgi:hypothetical protein
MTMKAIAGERGRTVDNPRRLAAQVSNPNHIAVISWSPKCGNTELLVRDKMAHPIAAPDVAKRIQQVR